ncbi:unnamed protein product [Parnassius mnemosyne]|uniref:Reverse transcriptase domain-containing protein n=1 Tax=Parnassius mnemosyne TaxID=213953 RepID=A0AAV1LIQ0_9NEOP
MLKRLQEFTTSHRILKDEQFGFKQNSTTSLACFNLIKIVTQAINDGLPVAAVFLDMSKAFDFVDHKLLLFKLEKYGIRGKANDWLRTYLCDRQQCVEISKIHKGKKVLYRSDYQSINFGVPQGSILGPFLFLIYINDLPNITRHNTILFADDTTVIVKCENADTYELEVNMAIKNIIDWLYCNNLQINIDKTKMIQFQTSKRQPLNINVKYKDTIIEQVVSTKFLGIMLDQNCNWKTHVDYICDKLDRFVYAIKRLRVTVSTEAALCAYHGYVSSVLSYGILLWGNSVDIKKVFRVQKKCVRAIYGAWCTDSCKPLFKKYNILTLPCLYIKEVCLFVKQHPEHFEKHIDVSKRNVAPRNKHKLYLPQCRLELHKRNSYVNAIKVYNKLPNSFKELPLTMFKKKLTQWLKEKCFYDFKEFISYCEK